VPIASYTVAKNIERLAKIMPLSLETQHIYSLARLRFWFSDNYIYEKWWKHFG